MHTYFIYTSIHMGMDFSENINAYADITDFTRLLME